MALLDEKSPEKSTVEIKEFCVNHGIDKVNDWNIAAYLNSARKQGKITAIKGKWRLTSHGREHLSRKGLTPPTRNVLAKARDDVRTNLSQITNPDTRKFVEETIQCLEFGLLRSAIVMSWIGATAILYNHVVANRLSDFNTEALRRKPKWKAATNADGLSSDMKEAEFLQVIETIGIIGNNVKQELEQCLKRRNSCGHPNSYQIGEQIVAAHIESLILNVYSKF